MYIAAVVKQGYTVAEMAKELSISRQTISNLCKETVSAGWVLCNKKDKRRYYQASDELCEAIVKYADYSSDMFQKTMVHEAEVLLGLLKRRKVALPIIYREK
jgi:transposase